MNVWFPEIHFHGNGSGALLSQDREVFVTKSCSSIIAVCLEGHRVAPVSRSPRTQRVLIPFDYSLSQVADIRITKAGGGRLEMARFTGAAAAKSRRYGGEIRRVKSDHG